MEYNAEQQSNRPLLTLAIPTYNRKNMLRECLDAICMELKRSKITNEVEIIISDNASTDGTEEMVRRDYSFVEYHRNSENLGVEHNVDKCFMYAHGKYTLIFSDDDIMLPGALCEILKVIKKEPDFIHLNTISFYRKFVDYQQCSAPRLNIKENIITEDKNKFLELVNIFITFLTSSVYKTELAQAVDRSVYDGTFTSSAQTVLLSMKGNGCYIIVAKPCAAARAGNTGGYNLFTVWVKGYKDLILKTGREVGINYNTLRNIYKKTMRDMVKGFILSYRTTEIGLSLENRRYIFNGVKEFPSLWFPLIFATYAPKWVLKLCKLIKDSIKKCLKADLLHIKGEYL